LIGFKSWHSVLGRNSEAEEIFGVCSSEVLLVDLLPMLVPAFQTIFLPDLIHVNFLPDEVAIEFNLLQAAPALTAALLALIPVGIKRERVIAANKNLRTCQT
jgi:hypothetical protein